MYIANLFCSTDQRSSLCRPNEIGRTWLSMLDMLRVNELYMW